MASRPELRDLTRIGAFMDDRMGAHGATPKGAWWRDQETMNRRFDKVMELLDRSRPCQLADLGCGYGALFDYCRRWGIELTQYIGYEVSDKMLEAARNRIDWAGAEFFKSDRIDRRVEYAVACGIFNIKLDYDVEAWQDHVIRTLDNMNEFSERGFAFTSLTARVDYMEDNLYYADSGFFSDYCKGNYSDHVRLIDDYGLWEWTMIVEK